MTMKEILELEKGDIITSNGCFLEVEDTSRLRQFGDIEVWNLEPNAVGELIRTDWDTLLYTIPELKKFTRY